MMTEPSKDNDEHLLSAPPDEPPHRLPSSSHSDEPSPYPPGSATKRCSFTAPMFVANLSVLMILNMTLIVYNVSVVRTLEKRFSLKSTETGLMWSMNDLTHICLVTFVAYFGRRAHKPRVLCVTMAFSAVAAFLMTTPYFLFPQSPTHHRYNSSSVTLTAQDSDALCGLTYSAQTREQVQTQCDFSGNDVDEMPDKHKSWYVFLFAQLLNGVGGVALQTLGLAYLDENSSKAKCSLYIGVVSSMYAFGPMGGLILSAVALRFPENPMADSGGLSPEDPMWIGCWWLGYAFCSVAVLLAITPMWFFPKHLLPPPSLVHSPRRLSCLEQDSSLWSLIKHNTKGFFKTLLLILKNKAFMTLLFLIVSMAYIIQGVFAQLVRYIEIHFMVPAFKAAIITAITAAGAGALGGFLGGLVMSCLRVTPRGGAWMMCIALGVTVAGLFGVLFMGCPQLQMAGSMDPHTDYLNVSTACSVQCGCTQGEMDFQPVCGADGVSYFSPCHAGCSSFNNMTYTGCSCLHIQSTTPMSSDALLYDTASPGLCNLQCHLVIPFAVVIFIICLMGSSARVPGTILQFRLVKPEEKSFALGLISFAMNLLAMIPGPVLFGVLIDQSCVLWQQTCTGSGVCLLFNTEHFRLRTYGVTLGYEMLSFLLSIVLIFLVSKMTFKLDGSDEKTVEVQAQDSPHLEMSEATRFESRSMLNGLV